MNKFDNMYLKKSTALQICVRNRLDKMKLRDFEEASTFFSEFEKAINDLKGAGASVSEREKLDYMLKMLPDSMCYIGDLIDSVQESERTCEFLKNKISMWELKNQSAERKKHSAFKAEKKNRSCHGCGKFGHFLKDCWAIESSSRSGDSGRGGNSGEAHAPRGARQQRRQAQQSHGSWRGGGRGNSRRGRWQTRGGAAGHYSEQLDDSSAGTFIAQVERKSEAAAYASVNHDIEWILDSGCSDHIINNDAYFDKSIVLRNPINVKVGDGRTLKGTKVGNVVTYFEVDGKHMKVDLLNVYYVKEMDKNLISFAKLTDQNKVVSIDNNSKIYNDKGVLIGVATKKNRLYKMNSFNNRTNSYVGNVKKMTQKERYHRLLGHVNFQYLNKMCKDKLVDGMPDELEPIYLKCGTCLQYKMHNLKFKNNRYKAREILEIVHTDVNRPHATTGYDGSKYFLSFIDDYSKCAVVYTINNKTEVSKCFENYLNVVENWTGKRIKKIRCDNGREFINNEMSQIADNRGIILELCPPYTHELNRS